MDTISCQHGNLARSCEICTLIAERDALLKENARFRKKLDREKIAKMLCGGRLRWNGLFELTRDGYRSEADVLIKYLTE